MTASTSPVSSPTPAAPAAGAASPASRLRARRRRGDQRWAARFTVEIRFGDDVGHLAGGVTEAELRERLWGAQRAVLRWRHDGKSRSATFRLPGALDEAVALHEALVAAIAGDGPADIRGRPLVAPGTGGDDVGCGERSAQATGSRLDGNAGGGPDTVVDSAGLAGVIVLETPAVPPSTTSGAALAANVVALHPGQADLAGVPVAANGAWDDVVDAPVRLADVDELVAWRMESLAGGLSVRRRPRAGSTLVNYATELGIAASFLRYQSGDVRLGHPGVALGASLRFDDSPAGITEADCMAFVDHRKHTNLSVRAANESALRRWAKAIERAERAAVRGDTGFVAPPAPRLTEELADARTVAATCATVASAMADAYRHGAIDANPWTPRVDQRIERVPEPHFTSRVLYSAEHIERITTAMVNLRQVVQQPDGRRAVDSGARYVAAVQLGYEAHLRPEELIAVRRSWLHIDGPNPGILVAGGEVHYPLEYSGAEQSRVFVSLKMRDEGETRWVPISRAGATRLAGHLERFVPPADLTSTDPDRHDPRVFSTATGAPLDLRRFAERWWRPALSAAFPAPGEAHLAALAVRMLRHSGITARLLAGHHYEDVASTAYNNTTSLAPQVPVSTVVQVITGGRDGTLAALLHLPALHTGRVIAELRDALLSLDVADPVPLEVGVPHLTGHLE